MSKCINKKCGHYNREYGTNCEATYMTEMDCTKRIEYRKKQTAPTVDVEFPVIRTFYAVMHKGCVDKLPHRAIINRRRDLAIRDFIVDNEVICKGLTWESAKKEGWVCKKIKVQCV